MESNKAKKKPLEQMSLGELLQEFTDCSNETSKALSAQRGVSQRIKWVINTLPDLSLRNAACVKEILELSPEEEAYEQAFNTLTARFPKRKKLIAKARAVAVDRDGYDSGGDAYERDHFTLFTNRLTALLKRVTKK